MNATLTHPSVPLITTKDQPRRRATLPGAYLIGYDGSPAARHALVVALDLARDGALLDVVYVKHMPMPAAWSSGAYLGELEALEQAADLLEAEIHTLLSTTQVTCHFQRRSGAVVHELLAAAADLHTRQADGRAVVIVVGPSQSRLHRLHGAVSAELTRRAMFPILVA